METYEQKRRRLFGKLILPAYLEELNKMTTINLKAEDLLSIVETDNFMNNLNLEETPILHTVFPFDSKSEIKLFFKKNMLNWNVPYILYLNYAQECGAAPLPNFNCFNLNFKFNDQHASLLRLIRADGEEEVFFDYDKEDNKRILELSIYRKK